MGKPAATLGCFHACPKVNPGPVPHIGGPVVQGSPNVLIGGMPAARKGDKIVCVGPPDTITEGSATVFINGKPAARMGDSTAHGGKIMVGNPSVIIGDGTYEYTYDEEFDDDDSSLFPDDYFDFLSGNGISSHETAKTKGHEEANTQKAKPDDSEGIVPTPINAASGPIETSFIKIDGGTVIAARQGNSLTFVNDLDSFRLSSEVGNTTNRLDIVTHGKPGSVLVGGQNVSGNQLGDALVQNGQLEGINQIKLFSCSTGCDMPGTENVAQSVSNKTKLPVSAPNRDLFTVPGSDKIFVADDMKFNYELNQWEPVNEGSFIDYFPKQLG